LRFGLSRLAIELFLQLFRLRPFAGVAQRLDDHSVIHLVRFVVELMADLFRLLLPTSFPFSTSFASSLALLLLT